MTAAVAPKFDFGKVGNVLHWFPSHMARALERIRVRLEGLDLIVEVRDARAPFASANPMLEDLCRERSKDRIVLFNKLDLSDPSSNDRLSRFCRMNNKNIQEDMDGRTEFMMLTTKKDPSLQSLLHHIQGLPPHR